MRLLKSTIHSDLGSLTGRALERIATRAIVLKGDDILLMYTERYHDYTLPGGGVDQGEDLITGLKRELSEETGAQNIRNIEAFGCYEEYRPWYKDDADYMHMLSYCYLCEIDDELGNNALEDYEINNGMKPVWLNIHHAIQHNLDTMENNPKAGMSVERETFLLQQVLAECLSENPLKAAV
ncbi:MULTISPECIES: NUDIX hydrolase [unclassified Agarivorans]|uniref:NUDIX hydrolase n=1 Tax=unclassified Agarivorans TaxID=2636026 RepID=UPI0026E267A1|nr:MULTISPECIES: NUDIX hydrolase [unclassified Agarivorans]MDO6687218.1 NUDIX hydrolase [Agarivorans sp. 3_MG-2023]MDO6716855.1 NUDIX hydrolase [Agarivorans sp. 2_MG-2023]